MKGKAWTALLLLGMGMLGCSKPPPPAKEIVRPVRTMRVAISGVARSRKFSGTARAGVTSTLSFKVAGTVQKVSVKVGDRVDKGQIIAELDPKDYDLQLQEAIAGLAQTKSQARVAKSSYDRVRALYENRNASKSDLDNARGAYDSANAAVRSMSKRIELARLRRDYCVLKAPSDGAIATVNIEENENVSPGTPVVVLTAGTRAEVTIGVPESLIAQARTGARATVTFDALPNSKLEAEISEVGVASAGATTFPVTVRLPDGAEGVRPGMAAEVELVLEQTGGKDRIVVPPFAVGSDHHGKFVFVARATTEGLGVVTRKAVEIGEITTQGLEIVTGLEDGELLVTAGVSRIRDGQTVKLPKLEE